MNKVIEALNASGLDVIVITQDDPSFVECEICKRVFYFHNVHDGDEFGIEGWICDDCVWELENGE